MAAVNAIQISVYHSNIEEDASVTKEMRAVVHMKVRGARRNSMQGVLDDLTNDSAFDWGEL